jgi:hypothetical protein
MLRLDWTLDLDAARGLLEVRYTLENHGPDPVHVLDEVLVLGATHGVASAPDAVMVSQSPDEPARVLFVRGYVQPSRDSVAYELLPGARLLAPGATCRGRATVGVPLAAWHPSEGTWPLDTTPREALLQIGVMPLAGAVEPLVLADGRTVQVPRAADAYQHQRFVSSTPLPLPAGSA